MPAPERQRSAGIFRARQSETAEAAIAVTGSIGASHFAVRSAEGMRWKLGYPPNISSPPTPDRTAFTCVAATACETKYELMASALGASRRRTIEGSACSIAAEPIISS